MNQVFRINLSVFRMSTSKWSKLVVRFVEFETLLDPIRMNLFCYPLCKVITDSNIMSVGKISILETNLRLILPVR